MTYMTEATCVENDTTWKITFVVLNKKKLCGVVFDTCYL